MRTGLIAAMLMSGIAAADDAPVIDSLTSANVLLDWWVISGSVTDEDPGTCTVDFGGVLSGRTTSVNGSGDFQLVVQIPSGGIVTAIAYDAAGNASSEEQTDAI